MSTEASRGAPNFNILSPKRKRTGRTEWEGFFPYYAGFSESFASAVLSSAGLTPQNVILDPWNGSGTTTHAASKLGLNSIGFDLNPVMIVVTKARLLPPGEADSLEPLGKEILRQALEDDSFDNIHNDPLSKWFTRKTTAAIRSIEASVRRHLIGALTITPDTVNLDRLTTVAAAHYVSIFSVCRDLTARFRSSNPTWLREPRNDERKQSISKEAIARRLMSKLVNLTNALTAQAELCSSDTHMPEVILADSTFKMLPDDSVDLIVTSPPYCTRIDYAAATRIELAVLHPLLTTSPKELARQMTGSTCAPGRTIQVSDTWGETCLKFLETLRKHPSKASATYYYRNHLDYFDKMYRSLANLAPSLRSGASAILVVQDSFYKDVHNDLPSIISDFAASNGLYLVRRDDFYFRQSMSGINPRARLYNRRPGAVEAVLCFTK
jgi:DNA modification methylase